jgi:hypothetical protein
MSYRTLQIEDTMPITSVYEIGGGVVMGVGEGPQEEDSDDGKRGKLQTPVKTV